MDKNISTKQIPPFPFSKCTWEATYSTIGPNDLTGYGHTEQQAIDDLIKETAKVNDNG